MADDNRTDSPQAKETMEAMEAFRFFPLSGKKEKGDRFLQPWLYGHVFATGQSGRGERKRAQKELKRFFTQKELRAILDQAGQDGQTLLETQLHDSARKYLKLCLSDDGFGRKLFGLVRMKEEEKEDKIIRDVYRSMIPLFLALPDLEEAEVMIQALDRACRQLLPGRTEDMEALVMSLDNDRLDSLLPPFEHAPEADGE